MVDREGMAAAFLARLAGDGCDVVTVLRADQYAGLASFADVGPFAPFQYDREGTLVRGVAPARFALALPDHPSEHLDLRVALWYREGWTATAAPAAPSEPKLVPIVTMADDADMDAASLASAYVDRWPRQENVVKDWVLPLDLDTNHGYATTPVESSEAAKWRAALEKHLANATRWPQGARVRYERATKRRLTREAVGPAEAWRARARLPRRGEGGQGGDRRRGGRVPSTAPTRRTTPLGPSGTSASGTARSSGHCCANYGGWRRASGRCTSSTTARIRS